MVGGADVAQSDPFFGYPDYHAVIWNNNTMSDLGLLGGYLSRATGINGQGQVAGYSDINASAPTYGVPLVHAFLWKNGVLTDLGTTPAGSTTTIFANAINDAGQIVGNLGQITSATCLCFSDTGAFLWKNGVMTNLNAFLPPGNPSPSPFSNLNIATAINRGGQIVGSGTLQTGQIHAYLLTPVSSSSTQSVSTAATANTQSALRATAAPQYSIGHIVTPSGVTIVIQ